MADQTYNQNFTTNSSQNQGFNQPPQTNQGFNQPPQTNQGFNQPPQTNQGFNQPPQTNQGFNQPPQTNQGFNLPPQYNNTQGFNQPPQTNQGFNQLPQTNQGFNQPSQYNNQGCVMPQNNYQPLLGNNGYQMQFCQDPMFVLAESEIAYVRQQVCFMELVSGCDTQNVYDVYTKNKQGQVVLLFKGKEKSGCCERQYCRGDSRPFKMHMKHVNNSNIVDPDMMDDFAVFDRPFKCTCFCLDRPKMKGFYKSEHGTMFGSITEPWTCCDPVMIIKDMNKEPQFLIHADCCQCGLICKNSCGVCADVKLHIYPSSCETYEPSKAIGTISKVSSGLLQEMLTDSDNYEIRFPPNASAEEKLLMIGATLLVDYRYFEDTTNDKDKRKKRQKY